MNLLKSSDPSLAIDKIITKASGAMAAEGFKGEISGKHCSTAITKK
jgi:hypothetical protein